MEELSRTTRGEAMAWEVDDLYKKSSLDVAPESRIAVFTD
jgi:hypothetical protein